MFLKGIDFVDHWGDPDVDGRTILRWIFRKWEGVVGTGWSWLRIGTGGGHLWVRWWTFGFRKMRGISWLAAEPVSFSRRTLLHGVSKYWFCGWITAVSVFHSRNWGYKQSYILLNLLKLSATDSFSVMPVFYAVGFCPKSQHSASSLLKKISKFVSYLSGSRYKFCDQITCVMFLWKRGLARIVCLWGCES